MWRMFRFSPEFRSYGRPGSGAGWASIEHPMKLLSPATWALHSPIPPTQRLLFCQALQQGQGAGLCPPSDSARGTPFSASFSSSVLLQQGWC